MACTPGARITNAFMGDCMLPSRIEAEKNLLRSPLRGTSMLKTGILNPAILSLLSRIRHTNTLVIADRGFPYWPQIETVDISLVDDIPKVLEVLAAVRANFAAGRVYQAGEFNEVNDDTVREAR